MADPVLTTPPDAPQPTDSKSVFNVKAFAFFGWFDLFINQMNSMIAWMTGRRDETKTYRDQAEVFRNQANDARNTVVASTAFKGPWAGLSGALNLPATVYHDGQYWVLLQSLANVQSVEPGADPAIWGATVAGSAISQELTASAVAVPGVRYLFVAPGVTLTLPADPQKGDYFGFVDCLGDQSCFVDFGTHNHRSRPVGIMTFDIPFSAGVVTYHDQEEGFV